MDELLEQIFYGKLVPFEKTIDKKSKHHIAFQELCNEEAKLSNNLNPEEQKQFKTYITKCVELQALEELNAFKIGFRLGGRLILQTLFSGGDK